MISADIGQLIRQARKAKGITQEQLAAMMFVSRQTVSHWENSRTQPDYETLNRLALLLDINLAEAFTLPAPSASCDEASPQTMLPDVSDGMPPEESRPSDEESNTPHTEECATHHEPGKPPAPEEVVQPPSERQQLPRVKALLLCATVAAVLLVFLLNRFTGQATYTPAYFTKTKTQSPGQAYVTLYVKDNRVNLQAGKNHPTWSYTLYLREDAGVGFQISSLRMVYFLDDGQTRENLFTTADIAFMKQTSHLNGYGLMMFAPDYTPSDQNPAHPTGVGALLSGQDDNGNALDFTLYIPFDPYP